MKMPDKVKIGGLTYAVNLTDVLHNGAGFDGEIHYDKCEIRIRPQGEARMQLILCHEVLHGVYEHLGYSNHDEKQIDELARALYALVVDNPELFNGNTS